jgi:dsRNA-specific ribonuclease
MSISMLNEYCQKYNINPPIYNYKSNGEDHSLEWFCVVHILDVEFVTKNPCSSKIKAKETAATHILQYIKRKKQNGTNHS